MKTGWIYVLHFDPPYAHAKHYVGFAEQPDKRIQEQLTSTGRRPSPLVRAAVASGARVLVVACFRGTRDEERRLKDGGTACRFCPLCRGEYNRKARDRMRARRCRIDSTDQRAIMVTCTPDPKRGKSKMSSVREH